MMTRRRGREGFSLVEILVALTMLAFAMTGIGRIMMVLDQRNSVLDLRSKRNFALMQQQTKFITMNYDTLTTDSAAFRAQKTLWAGDLQYYRRVSISSIGNDQYSIKVVIIPSGLHGSNYNYNDTLQKDSVIF